LDKSVNVKVNVITNKTTKVFLLTDWMSIDPRVGLTLCVTLTGGLNHQRPAVQPSPGEICDELTIEGLTKGPQTLHNCFFRTVLTVIDTVTFGYLNT
jgi:hypothetical protein